jgi:hypothetical protein
MRSFVTAGGEIEPFRSKRMSIAEAEIDCVRADCHSWQSSGVSANTHARRVDDGQEPFVSARVTFGVLLAIKAAPFHRAVHADRYRWRSAIVTRIRWWVVPSDQRDPRSRHRHQFRELDQQLRARTKVIDIADDLPSRERLRQFEFRTQLFRGPAGRTKCAQVTAALEPRPTEKIIKRLKRCSDGYREIKPVSLVEPALDAKPHGIRVVRHVLLYRLRIIDQPQEGQGLRQRGAPVAGKTI